MGSMKRGYCECACRDCFEVAIRGDDEDSALCSECEGHGCDRYGTSDCQAPQGYDDLLTTCGTAVLEVK